MALGVDAFGLGVRVARGHGRGPRVWELHVVYMVFQDFVGFCRVLEGLVRL